MRALELTGFDGPSSLRLGERPEPAPGPGEVRVRLRAMGLNHLDVFVSRGLPRPHRPLPVVLGADGAGAIDAVGADVGHAAEGDEVILYPVRSCGKCEACLSGNQVHCRTFAILGEHTEGTFQEALVVPANVCFPRPPHLSWEEAGVLPLAWLTAWRLLFSRGRLQAGDTLVVVGVGGGVAGACLLLAKARGLRVFATSRDPEKRAMALSLGAEAAFPSESFSEGVLEATGRQGVRAVVDTVGPATFDQSIRSLGREGQLLVVGATSGPRVELVLPRLWFRHLSIVSSTMGNRSDFEAMLETVTTHQLRPPLDRVYPLDRGAEAFAWLESQSQFGKVGLVP